MPAGRPTKLTPELQEKIVTAVRGGNYIETAAAYAGVSKDTLYAWLKRGARATHPNSPYRRFSDAIEKALAEAEMRDVLIIGKAAEEQWQAAAWRLERKFADRWGRQVQVKQELSGQVAMQHGATSEFLDRIAAAHPELVDTLFGGGSETGDGPAEP